MIAHFFLTSAGSSIQPSIHNSFSDSDSRRIAVVRLEERIPVPAKDVTISKEELLSRLFEADAALLPVAAEGFMMKNDRDKKCFTITWC